MNIKGKKVAGTKMTYLGGCQRSAQVRDLDSKRLLNFAGRFFVFGIIGGVLLHFSYHHIFLFSLLAGHLSVSDALPQIRGNSCEASFVNSHNVWGGYGN